MVWRDMTGILDHSDQGVGGRLEEREMMMRAEHRRQGRAQVNWQTGREGVRVEGWGGAGRSEPGTRGGEEGTGRGREV